MKHERYVVIDSRTTCGNSVFFWCWDAQGYTCDLRMAAIYTEEEAERICKRRSTDKMARYSDILKLVQHHVDIQDFDRKITKKHMRIKNKFPHTYYHLEVRK